MIELISEHQHKPKPVKELSNPIEVPEHSSGKVINTIEQLRVTPLPQVTPSPKKQNFVKPVLQRAISPKSTAPSVNLGLEQLNILAKAARDGLSITLIREIYRRKRLVEDRVYTSSTKGADDYLKFIYQAEMDIKLQERLGIQDLLSQRLNKVKEKVENGEVKVENKEQLHKDNLSDMFKIREGQLRKKIDELQSSMNKDDESEIKKDGILLDPNYFSKDNPKTKEAQAFVRKLRDERIAYEQRKQEEKRRWSELRQHKHEQSEKSQINQKSERHHKLIEKLELKQELKEKEAQANSRRLDNFRKFMKQYKAYKPLFKKKEEQFEEKVLQPEYEKYQMRLEQIKLQHRPIDIEQIKKHEKRYMDFLNDNRARKVEEVRTMQQKTGNRQYFKGQYRYQVLEDMNKQKEVEDPKLFERMKKVRQLLYADDVKSRFVPRIDQQKKAQMEEIKKKHSQSVHARTIEASPIVEEDGFRLRLAPSIDMQDRTPQKDGLRNLKYLHSMISSLKKDGKVKKKPDQLLQLQTLEPKPNYLKQLRQKKEAEQPETPKSIILEEHDKINNVDEQERLKMKVQLLDQQARRREKRIRLNSHTPSEASQLQNQYLQSINVKLSLLNSNELHIQ